MAVKGYKKKEDKKPKKFFHVKSHSIVSESDDIRELKKKLRELPNSERYIDALNRSLSNSGLFEEVETEANETLSDDSSIYIKAEVLIEQLEVGNYSLGALTLENKCMLFYYLARYNRRVGRILDIQSKLPMSSIRLEPPKYKYKLVSDYVFNFFSNMFNDPNFQKCLMKMVQHYWLFSFAAMVIEDDYCFCKEDSTLDGLDLKKDLHRMLEGEDSEDVKKFSDEELDEIDREYTRVPEQVGHVTRLEFVKQVLNIHSPNYSGPVSIKVLPALATVERRENDSADYYIYKIDLSQPLRETIDNLIEVSDGTYEDVYELGSRLGYSHAIIKAVLDARDEQIDDARLVDTDPFNDRGMYVVNFERPGLSGTDNSLFNRVLNDCIDLASVTKRLRDKVNRGFKKDLLVQLDSNVTQEQIDQIDNAITTAASNKEGTIITTNIQANVADLDLNVNNNLDLSEIKEQAERNIAEGIGIPESLLTDSTDAYSNSFLKTLLLENEFVSFRNAFTQFVEDKIFKPIAIKKGFIVRDEWGEAVPLYPKLKFNRLSLARGTDDFEQLLSLASEGKLPLSIIYETLGFDPLKVAADLRKEQFTLMSDSMKELLTAELGETYGEQIAKLDSIRRELEDALDLPEGSLKAEGGGNGEEDDI